MIVGDENQKGVTSTSGIPGVNVAIMSNLNVHKLNTYESVAMYSKGNNNPRFKKNYTNTTTNNLYCDFCILRNHNRIDCCKLNGYPTDYKSKKKAGGNAGNAAVYNVSINNAEFQYCGMVRIDVYSQNYGAGMRSQAYNTDVTTIANKSQKVTTNQQAGFPNQQSPIVQLGNGFTLEQYEEIKQMLNNSTPAASVNVAHAAGTEWIIDTGATNHMVSDINLLNKSSITENSISKPVYLPNGDITQVTHTGASSISSRNIVTNLFHVPQFKSLQWEVKEIGKEDNGLYILINESSKHNNQVTLVADGRVQLKEINIRLWHRRLGHTSITVLQKIFPLDRHVIHAEVDKWPYEGATFDGNKFFLTVVDDYSRMTWIFLLKHKSDVFLFIQQFLRMPSPVIGNQSPFERVYHMKPSLGHLRVLGCLCFAKVILEHDKLKPRIRSAIHMGYSEVQKGYTFYDIEDHQFYVSRVVFKEECFPFATPNTRNTSYIDSSQQSRLFPAPSIHFPIDFHTNTYIQQEHPNTDTSQIQDPLHTPVEVL
ncbi:uncharacterized protein LOC132637791 [Lycium barbarum]|uniref:uncharacterized protein LOC132637791 n=1 Tax=Lycium barbarum TaxID=112863 RepID=UPI00293F2D65|nr:uncharacterized protein LOC132637791 [Lycium barbarum]